METTASSAVVWSFVLYTAFIVLVGIYAGRLGKRSGEDYLLAGRSLGPWVAAVSASASSESGWVTLGLVGEAFTDGLVTIWVMVGCLAGYTFNWFVMAKPMRAESRRSGSLTIPDLLSARHPESEKSIRWVGVLIIATMMTGYVAAQFGAAGKAFNAVFGVDYVTGVLIGAAIVVLYTFTGGFRAVAWTDLLQGLLMVISLVILPWIVIAKLGGPGAMFADLAAQAPGLVRFDGGNALRFAVGAIIGSLGIGLGYPGQPHVVIRFFAMRDELEIKKARFISLGWGILVFSGAILLGLATRALFKTLPDAETALPIVAVEMLPGVLAGMMLAAILAAICSTADSQLLVAASAVGHDIIHKVFGKSMPEKTRVLVDRLSVIVLGVIALLFAAGEVRVVFDFVLYAWSGLGAGFAPALILSFFWKRTTGKGVVAGMFTGLLVTVVWRNVPALKAIVYELVPAFILAFVVVWLVSSVTRSTSTSARTTG
jgi:sodium/proline symporter